MSEQAEEQITKEGLEALKVFTKELQEQQIVRDNRKAFHDIVMMLIYGIIQNDDVVYDEESIVSVKNAEAIDGEVRALKGGCVKIRRQKWTGIKWEELNNKALEARLIEKYVGNMRKIYNMDDRRYRASVMNVAIGIMSNNVKSEDIELGPNSIRNIKNIVVKNGVVTF